MFTERMEASADDVGFVFSESSLLFCVEDMIVRGTLRPALLVLLRSEVEIRNAVRLCTVQADYSRYINKSKIAPFGNRPNDNN